jgi:hypothetical protein
MADQQKVERRFRFLKASVFTASTMLYQIAIW